MYERARGISVDEAQWRQQQLELTLAKGGSASAKEMSRSRGISYGGATPEDVPIEEEPDERGSLLSRAEAAAERVASGESHSPSRKRSVTRRSTTMGN
eukprot:3547324-Prymnesium_polylepis.2